MGKALKKLSFEPGVHNAPRPPYMRGLPLIGPVTEFLRDPNRYFIRCYRRLGPVFRVRLGRRTYVVLAGAEASNWYTRHGRPFISTRGVWDEVARLTGGNIDAAMTSQDGARHAQLRGLYRHSMSRAGVAPQLPDVYALARARLADVPEHASVDIVSVAKRMVFEQLGVTMTGEAPDTLYQDAQTVLDAIIQATRFPIFQQLPVPRPVRAAMRNVRRTTERLRREVGAPGERRSFVHDILGGLEAGLYAEADLPMLLMTPFVAGLDTMAHSMAFALYHLATHADVLEAVQREVDMAFERTPHPTQAELKACTTLRQALMESARLNPISPGHIRTVKAPVVLGGYQLREGDYVMIPHSMPHLMGEHFPDPDRFDPTRFDRGEHKAPGVYAPYGVGAHICLGAAVADLLLQANIAVLLRNYDLALANPDAPLRVSWSSVAVPKGLRLTLRPRWAHGIAA